MNHFTIKQKLLLKGNVLMLNELQIRKDTDQVELDSRLFSPPFRTQRAQLRHWAQDNLLHVFISSVKIVCEQSWPKVVDGS